MFLRLFFFFSPPFRWDRMARVGLFWLCPFSQERGYRDTRDWLFTFPRAVSLWWYPSRLGSDKLISPWWQALLRTECTGWPISKLLLFSSPYWKPKGIFLWDIFYGNLVKLLEANITMLYGGCVSWSFLTLRFVHTELQQFVNYSLAFPALVLFSGEASAHDSQFCEAGTPYIHFFFSLTLRTVVGPVSSHRLWIQEL